MPNTHAAMPAEPDPDPDAPYLAVLLEDFTNNSNANAVSAQAFDPVLANSELEAFDLALQHHNFDGAQQPTTQLLMGSPDALVDGMLVETVSAAFGSSPQQHQARCCLGKGETITPRSCHVSCALDHGRPSVAMLSSCQPLS